LAYFEEWVENKNGLKRKEDEKFLFLFPRLIGFRLVILASESNENGNFGERT